MERCVFGAPNKISCDDDVFRGKWREFCVMGSEDASLCALMVIFASHRGRVFCSLKFVLGGPGGGSVVGGGVAASGCLPPASQISQMRQQCSTSPDAG